MNMQKTLADTNACLKNICIEKEISFNDNSAIKEFHLGKRKLLLKRRETVPLQKIYCIM